MEDRIRTLEIEVARLRSELDALKSGPPTCGHKQERHFYDPEGRPCVGITRCQLARGHAGRCDSSVAVQQIW